MSNIDLLEPRRLFASDAGTVDPDFGISGSAAFQYSAKGYVPTASDIAVAGDGRTIAGAYYEAHALISVGRLNADGTRDASFGKRGYATLPIARQNVTQPFQLAVDHAGRVLVLYANTLTRLDAAGKVDATFGTRGSLTLPVLRAGTDVAVDGRDRPVVVGTAAGRTGDRATVIRLGVRGALDTGFGVGGAYKTPVPEDETFADPGDAAGRAVTVLDDGRIVGAATLRYLYTREFSNAYVNGTSVFRLNADGSLDADYGTGGVTAVTSRADDVTDADSAFASFYPGGGAIVQNDSASIDSPTPQGSRSWSYVNRDGRLKKDRFGLVPAGVDAPRSSVTVAGVQADGKLLMSTGTRVYRLTTNFKLDDAFTPVTTTANARTARPRGTDASDLLIFAPGGNSTFNVTAVIA